MLNKRKHFPKLLPAVLALALFITSCKKDALPTEEASGGLTPDEQVNAPLLKQAIINRGFKESDIEDKGTYYLVQGDIAVYKEDSAKYVVKDNPPAHQRMTYLVDFFFRPETGTANWQQRAVTYYVDYSVGSYGAGNDDWWTEVVQAVNEWNAVPQCGVFLVAANNAAEADIFITNDGGTLDNYTIAQASLTLPNGDPGPTIKINVDYLQNKNVPSAQKKYNMAHELGHCLGLFHTNSFDGSYIPGTPSSDPSSVMNGGTAESVWNGFSQGDMNAIRTLYPMPLRGAITEIPGSYAVPDDGFGPISWDPSKFAGSTVKIELFRSWNTASQLGYFRYIFAREIAAAAPNTGVIQEGINYAIDPSYDLSSVKITSNENPAQYAFSNRFPMGRD